MSSAPPPISDRALNRALLARQLLLERSGIAPLDAIERLAGMQSQAPNPPFFGLWTRLTDFQHEDLGTLIVERKAVRLALMRATIHLVSSEDALAWRPLLQQVLERGYLGVHGRKLGDLDRAAVAAHGRELVEHEPMTFADLGKKLIERWPDHSADLLSAEIRTSSALVQVPPRGLWGQGGASVHTTMESWLGRDPKAEPQIEELVRRYLAAFGPASVRDFQAWSGLTRIQAVVDAMRSELLVFQDERGREVFDLPEAPRPDAETPAPARFLPEWDNILLAYADFSRIVSQADRKRVMTANGIVFGSILIDGFVTGVWRLKKAKNATTLTISPFRTLNPSAKTELLDEGSRLLEFAAPDSRHEISIAESR